MASELSIDAQLYQEASMGDLEVCKALVARGGNVNVALIAAQYLADEKKQNRKEISEWCLDHGACYIFICNHHEQSYIGSGPKGLKYNKPISMLKD
jgi:hypothetical protein